MRIIPKNDAMHVALVIATSLVAVGSVLYLHHRLTYGRHKDSPGDTTTDAPDGDTGNTGECCGMHITCERDSLSPVFGGENEYFDDEELDVYAGRGADDYTPDEIEQFRDVLLTLLPEDIAPWARSIQQRGIELPEIVRDELFIIVNEERQKRLAV